MAKSRNTRKQTKENKKEINRKRSPEQKEKPHSWAVVRSLFTCKHLQAQMQQQQLQKAEQQQQKKNSEEKKQQKEEQGKQEKQMPDMEENHKKCKKIKCSGSLCSNTKVMHRPEPVSPEDLKKRASSSMGGSFNTENVSCRSIKVTLNDLNGAVVSASSSSSSMSAASTTNSPLITGSFRGMPFRKFSSCYECRMVVDPVLGMTRDPSLRSTICSCPECGEIFMKAENLELHQAVRHAVSELGPEDTSKNIVEIIFQSSWLKKQTPVCKIDRILKVHNTSKTVSRFEEYRDSIKDKATKHTKKHPRCIADGNELLRFHCTTFMCSLGLNGSSNLCNSIPNCNVCSIIKNGFKVTGEFSLAGGVTGKAILTTATSGKAHDNARVVLEDDKRAMLVCRVIAGRVKRNLEGSLEEYDSVAGAAGVYSNLDELYVFNPKAILPCFVVIYRGF
ncbi:uncharacterized protein [Coffea arabica]|uniref:C2H2-type domain-containing protein n=1 Tax=Coffea arabica TaxID=13443 RepID=A0A6P6UPC9_COFAR|nr:uncharacterized protein LOC113712355 [Coffea arabica]